MFSKAWWSNAKPIVLALGAAAAFAACDERLDGGMACPALCPTVPTTVSETTLFAVQFDSSVAGFPSIGSELFLFIASMGDTLDTRGVVRFDSLPQTFRHLNTVEDSLIVAIDTGAVVKLRLFTTDTLVPPGPPVTVELYDVDLNGQEDVDPTSVATAFTPDRLMGSRTFAAESLKDSVRIPIDRDKLLAKIQTEFPGNRLRLGIRVTSTESAKLTMAATNSFAPGFAGAQLDFRPAPDSTVALLHLNPRSLTPSELFLAGDLADYLVIVRSPPDPPSDVLRIGGLPGRRAYFRFDIPSRIVDSSSVVRATLLLTQRPNPFSPEAGDTLALEQYAVTAGPAITDVARALHFLTSSTLDSVRVVAADSGQRAFEMIGLVRAWRGTTESKTPRAFAIRARTEGQSARQADFYSMRASIDVRPRLRITYLPQQPPGFP